MLTKLILIAYITKSVFTITLSDSHFVILIIPYYRLILTAILVTSKFYNDVFYGNHFLAYVGGIQLPEMNVLESQFLDLLDWSLWVEP